MTWYGYGLLAAAALGTYNFLYAMIPKGVSSATTIIGVGLGLIMLGATLRIFSGIDVFEMGQFKWPIVAGVVLGLGILMVTRAFMDPNMKVSQLVPLININTLVSVILGLVILKEYQTAPLVRVVAGTILIILGAVVIR